MVWFSGCLTCGDVAEPYHPDRVLRQFQMVQTIPRAPLRPNKSKRGRTAQGYIVTFGYLAQLWDQAIDHLLQNRSCPITRPSDCVPGYLEWYRRVSHPIVQNPKRRSTHQPHVPDFEDTRYAEIITVSLNYKFKFISFKKNKIYI